MEPGIRKSILALLFVIVGLVTLAILASGGVIWAAPTAQRGTVPPPPCCLPGIVFNTNRDGNDEIYIMRSDGSGLLRLTTNPALDQQPTATMDGTRVAFSTNRDDPDPLTCGQPGKPNCVFHLYTMNVDGSDIRQITTDLGADANPTYAMSNGRIAFVSTRDDPDPRNCGQAGRPACITHIYIVNADGSGLRRVTSNPASNTSALNFSPNWSPDDQRLAFVSNRDGNDEIYTIFVDGSGLNRVTYNPAADGHPAWSPDGTQLAFETNRDSNYQIYKMNADGSAQTRVTNVTADDRYPIWIPGCDERIVFASTRDGGVSRIWAVDPDGSNLSRLTTIPTGVSARDIFPSWSGLPAALGFPGPCCVPGVAFDSQRDGNSEIYLMRGDGSRQTRLTNNTAVDRRPAPSRDGISIAFESNRDGRFHIYVMGVDGTNPTQLTFGTGEDMEPVWSNDNKRIAFVSTRDDADPNTCGQTGKPACSTQIYVTNWDGSGLTRLTFNPPGNPGAVNENPAWSPDDKYLVFQSNRDGNDELYRINSDGTGLARLTNDNGSDGHPSISPDGKRIAFESNRDGKFQVYVMKVDGTGAAAITKDGENRRPYWCPSCIDRIAFVSNRDGVNFSVYSTNADGSNQVRLTTQAQGVTSPDDNPSWSGTPPKLAAPSGLIPIPTPTPGGK